MKHDKEEKMKKEKMFGYIALCIILFKTKGLWLEMVAPILSLEITFIVVWLWRYSTDVKK